MGKQRRKKLVNKKNGDKGQVPGKIISIFCKEIEKRGTKSGPPAITSEMISCDHTWFHEHSGGEICQICDFETTKKVWGCLKNECNLTLCGSCAWKWKKKAHSTE